MNVPSTLKSSGFIGRAGDVVLHQARPILENVLWSKRKSRF